MARTTVDLTPVSPTARGIGRQGSGAVQYRANPNAGSSAELLANSLNVVLDASQRNDQRKIDEANKKFELEFDSYVSKALQGDNTTGIQELDTLYPDMSMTRKLMILKAAGKATMERDENFQSLVASIGAPSTNEFGSTTGFANTLDGINQGYASAEQYIREIYGESNGAYVSGMLGYLDGQRSAQVQQYVAGKRADELKATQDEFQTTDVSLAASGDWDALERQDKIWVSAGKNDFIQGGTRNAYILQAATDQAVLSRNIEIIRNTPEKYKGAMKDKPELWNSYMADVERRIADANAADVQNRINARSDEISARKQDIRQKMLDPSYKPSDEERRFIEIHSDLSGSFQRLKDNLGIDKNDSKINAQSLLVTMDNAGSQDDLDALGLTLEVINDAEQLELWARTQEGIRPEDTPALIAKATTAGRVTNVKSSPEYTSFTQSIEGILSPLKRTNFNTGDTLAVGNNDTIAYSTAKEFAEKEYQELLEITIEENDGRQPTKRQLREIRESVVGAVEQYKQSIDKVAKDPTASSMAIQLGQQTIDALAVRINGVNYRTVGREEAAEAQRQGKTVRRASADQNNPAFNRFIIQE
jgi:hypothetical protein